MAPNARPTTKMNAVIPNQRGGPDNKADVTSKAAATAMQVKTTRRDLAIDLTCGCYGMRSTAGEAVANSDDSFDAVATRIELLSQATNVNVQRPRVAVIAVAPDLIQQLLTGDNATFLFR